jgi:thioredoxin reductase
MSSLSASNPVIGIIGGGPAGMACALWLKQLGLSPHIIERNPSLGGQLLILERINRWVLGLPGRTSAELAELFKNHIIQENIPVNYNSRLIGVETAKAGYRLILQGADRSQSAMPVQSIVIATGVRALGSEIFSSLPGFDLLYAASLICCFPIDHLNSLENLRGKTVAVIGGGDNAHFTVKDIALVAARTYILMRSRPKAQKKLHQEIKALIDQGLVIEYLETEVKAFRQIQDGIEISLNQSGSIISKITVDKIFTRVGFAPNCEFLGVFQPFMDIKKQTGGYLYTDAWQRTSIASVYAIGDVASPEMQSVVTAIADGAKAAHSISQDLEARGNVNV